jgi:putative Mg2+ transporter-C (MgtC) family protein
VAAGIVAGIGFLGAGTIIRSAEGTLVGLTTASSIWAIAAIGMVAGAGLYELAAIATAVVFVALSIFKRFE